MNGDNFIYENYYYTVVKYMGVTRMKESNTSDPRVTEVGQRTQADERVEHWWD